MSAFPKCSHLRNGMVKQGVIMGRKDGFEVGSVHHIVTRTIAGYRVFDKTNVCNYMRRLLMYYQAVEVPCKFSNFASSPGIFEFDSFDEAIYENIKNRTKQVNVIAFCLMPTHIHIVLEELVDGGIVNFLKNVLIAFTRYYNTRFNRKGPMWEGRFKNIRVKTDEQLIHLTRYVHLNPVTAVIVDSPERWSSSSYNEYISDVKIVKRVTNFEHLIDISRQKYSKFTMDQKDYQRQLALIKSIIFE